VTDPVSDVVPTIDPAIEALILEASQQQLIAYVRQLESFGTRNAFSDTQSETFGIGAAALDLQRVRARGQWATDG
jgi:hypothetical protein